MPLFVVRSTGEIMSSVGSACSSLTCYAAASASFDGIFFIYLTTIIIQSSTLKQLSFTFKWMHAILHNRLIRLTSYLTCLLFLSNLLVLSLSLST